MGVGRGNDNWVPSLEGAVRGRWVRYKDCGCSFTRRGSLAFFCIFHYQVQLRAMGSIELLFHNCPVLGHYKMAIIFYIYVLYFSSFVAGNDSN